MLRFLVLAAAVACVTAQVPHSFDAYTPMPTPTRGGRRVSLPAMDIEANMKKAEQLQRMDGIFEFAQVNHVVHPLLNDSSTITYETGTLHTLSFTMENAVSMAFYFDQFHIPNGTALYLVSDREVAGPFTSRNNWRSGDFQTRHIKGSHVEAQFFTESHVRDKPLLNLAVVSTAFRTSADAAKDAMTCNINTACIAPENKCKQGCEPTDASCSVQCTYKNQDASKGQWAGEDWSNVVRGTVAVGRDFNSRYCSGSFINNKEGKQYVLTAAHCGPSASDLVQLNFENPKCSGEDDEDGPTMYTAGDIKTLVRNTDVDNELIEIGEAIPDDWEVFLNGYDSTDKDAPASSVVGVHHPAGAVKKISYSDKPVVPGAWVSSTSDNHWRVEFWTVGTTEGGSSGSPLFNADTKRIIGQLHGGTAACPAENGWDVYGAIWAGYTDGEMKQYLGEPKMDGEPLSLARLRSNASPVQ